jgi:hypothetical protein
MAVNASWPIVETANSATRTGCRLSHGGVSCGDRRRAGNGRYALSANHGAQYASTHGRMGRATIDRLCTPQRGAASTYTPIGRASGRHRQNGCVIWRTWNGWSCFRQTFVTPGDADLAEAAIATEDASDDPHEACRSARAAGDRCRLHPLPCIATRRGGQRRRQALWAVNHVARRRSQRLTLCPDRPAPVACRNWRPSGAP